MDGFSAYLSMIFDMSSTEIALFLIFVDSAGRLLNHFLFDLKKLEMLLMIKILINSEICCLQFSKRPFK